VDAKFADFCIFAITLLSYSADISGRVERKQVSMASQGTGKAIRTFQIGD